MAMHRGPHGIFYGVSQSFKDFALKHCPWVASDNFMDIGCTLRRLDFVEVFSGRGHLSAQLREVFRQHCFWHQV